MTEILLLLAEQNNRDTSLTKKQLARQADALANTLEGMELFKRPANLNLCGRDRKRPQEISDNGPRCKTPIPVKQYENDFAHGMKVPINAAESILKGFSVHHPVEHNQKYSITPSKTSKINTQRQSDVLKQCMNDYIKVKSKKQSSHQIPSALLKPRVVKTKIVEPSVRIHQKSAHQGISKRKPNNNDLPQDLEQWINQAQKLLSSTLVFENYLENELQSHYRSRSAQGALKSEELQSDQFLKSSKGISRNIKDLTRGRSSITPQQPLNDSLSINKPYQSHRKSITPERQSLMSSEQYTHLGEKGGKFKNFLRKNSGQSRGPHLSKALNMSSSKLVTKNLKADQENNCCYDLEGSKRSLQRTSSKHKLHQAPKVQRSPFGQMSNKMSLPLMNFEVIQEQIIQERLSVDSEAVTERAEIQTGIIEKAKFAPNTLTSVFWKQQVEKDKAKLEKMQQQYHIKKLQKQGTIAGKQTYM